MKIIIDKNFEHEGETYEPGQTVDLPEEIAKEAIEKGYAKNTEEIEDEMEIKSGEEVGTSSEEEGFPEEVSMPSEEERAKEGEEEIWEELESELDEQSRSPTWQPEEVGDQLLENQAFPLSEFLPSSTGLRYGSTPPGNESSHSLNCSLEVFAILTPQFSA